MHRRSLSVVVAAALVAVAVLCAPVVPAGAAAADVGAGGGGVTGYGVVTVGPHATYWCVAVATTAAASTSVDSCRLYADGVYVTEAPSVSLAGPVAATSGTAWVSPGKRAEVCWVVSSEPIVGPRVTRSGCEPAIMSTGVEGSGGAFVVAPLNPYSSLVAFWCAGVATVPASSVTVESCRLYVDGVVVAEAEPLALSGPAAATTALASVPTVAIVKVCWEVSASTFFDGQLTDEGCSGDVGTVPA